MTLIALCIWVSVNSHNSQTLSTILILNPGSPLYKSRHITCFQRPPVSEEVVISSYFALLTHVKSFRFDFLKPVLGGVDGILHFPVPSMNRLNQTKPATFSILLCWTLFRDSVFLYWYTIHVHV
jgi:hypothetical protein